MANIARPILAACAACSLLIVMPGCDKTGPGGPAERAGREVDKAVEKAGKSIEKAGERLQDAAKGK